MDGSWKTEETVRFEWCVNESQFGKTREKLEFGWFTVVFFCLGRKMGVRHYDSLWVYLLITVKARSLSHACPRWTFGELSHQTTASYSEWCYQTERASWLKVSEQEWVEVKLIHLYTFLTFLVLTHILFQLIMNCSLELSWRFLWVLTSYTSPTYVTEVQCSVSVTYHIFNIT